MEEQSINPETQTMLEGVDISSINDPVIISFFGELDENGKTIKTKKELLNEIMNYGHPELNEIVWIETTVKDDPHFDKDKLPDINRPISKKEIVLSKLIGVPYPSYIFDGVVDYKHDNYEVTVREPKEEEQEEVKRYEKAYQDNIMQLRNQVLAKLIKLELLEGDTELGYVIREVMLDDTRRQLKGENLGVMPKKLYELGEKYGVGFTPRISAGTQGEGTTYTAETKFMPYEECRTHEKDELLKRSEKLEKTKNKDKEASYTVRLPIYPKSVSMLDIAYNIIPEKQEEIKPIDYVLIKMSAKELAKAQILPTDPYCKKIRNREVLPTDIAEASKGLTTSKFAEGQGIFARLMEKAKNIINNMLGKGEK